MMCQAVIVHCISHHLRFPGGTPACPNPVHRTQPTLRVTNEKPAGWHSCKLWEAQQPFEDGWASLRSAATHASGTLSVASSPATE
jgi:hypothetical protein